MLPFWFFYAIPVIGLLASRRFAPSARSAAWWLAGLLLTLAIGLRHQVGGDWFAYIGYLERASSLTFQQILLQGDPGYYLLNWLVAGLGGGIYSVNLACGALLMSGILVFARRQPLPWLALLVSVPYLVIVVGMGYTRQAVALGFVLLGLAALADGRARRFAAWVLIGAAFHKSAVLLLPVAALAASEKRLWALVWMGAITFIGGYLFLFDSADALWMNYVEADIQSEGGFVRVSMNAVPALLFLVMRNRFSLDVHERRLWWWISVFALACVPLVLLSSTATDRVALYLIPLQIFVFSRLPLIAGDRIVRAYLVLSVSIYYAAVEAVWLLFATHSVFWLPYQMYPFAL